jgi:putative sugar O-methyltransferase
MYVQTYAFLGRSLDLLAKVFRYGPRRFRPLAEVLRKYIDGSAAAWSDYRVLAAAESDRPPCLLEIGESDFGGPAEQYCFDGKRYSVSFLSYLRGLALLKKLVGLENIGSALEIGGGYGTLGEILLKCRDRDRFYVDVDIPPVAFVATHYLQAVFGADQVAGYDKTRELEVIDLEELRKKYRAVVLCAWQLPRVRGCVDLFVNFVSFQEMEPDVVRNYIGHVQPLTRRLVLLRNSVRGKPIAMGPAGLGVKEPVVRADYLAGFNEFEVLGADSAAFGNRGAGDFVSECMVLRRKG